VTAGILLIDAAARAAIDQARERAKTHVISREVLEAGAAPGKFNVTLADRKPGFERPPSEHLVLGTYRVAFSLEDQPMGLCAHLSASSPAAGKVPGPEVMEVLAREFGFAGDFPQEVRVWLEEFDPGHRAVNLLWVVL